MSEVHVQKRTAPSAHLNTIRNLRPYSLTITLTVLTQPSQAHPICTRRSNPKENLPLNPPHAHISTKTRSHNFWDRLKMKHSQGVFTELKNNRLSKTITRSRLAEQVFRGQHCYNFNYLPQIVTEGNSFHDLSLQSAGA